MRIRAFVYAAVVLFALLLSTWPHIEAWRATGDPTWIADNDEFGIYLPTAAHAYHNGGFTNADPVFADGRPTSYPWMQIMPGTLIARWLGLGPFGISIVWRALAGITTAMAWLFLLRGALQLSFGASVFSSVVLLGDINGFFGKLLIRHFTVFGRALTSGADSAFLGAGTNLHAEWRIISPGLSLWFLLIFFAFFLRARQTGSTRFVLAAGVGLGLLFHVYFYYWTFVLLGLALTVASDLLGGRRREALISVFTGVLGVFFGLPSLWANFSMKRAYSEDWLHRMDKFLKIPRTSELLIPYGSLALLALLFWIDAKNGAKRRVELLFVAGGFLLLNHQLLTGLQIENFHWGYATGPLLAALSLVIAFDLSNRLGLDSLRPFTAVLALVACAHVGAAAWLRQIETHRLPDSLVVMSIYNNFKKQAAVLPAGTVVAGDVGFAEASAIGNGTRALSGYSAMISPSIDNSELDERVALDAYLVGEDAEMFRSGQKDYFERNGWGPWVREAGGRERRMEKRIAAYTKVAANWEAAAERFAVRAVAIPVAAAPALALARNPTWTQTVRGPLWNIWVKNP